MEPMTTEDTKSAGELLKQGRLKQRLSIAECAKRTHIASRYIEALEDERWTVLPSESHRLGFLKLYSRFLGVPVDDVLTRYGQKTPEEPADKHSPKEKPHPIGSGEPRTHLTPAIHSRGWSPSSIPQVIGLAILVLIFAWVLYHTVSPRLDQSQMPWTRRRNHNQSRLVTSSTVATVQKVRLTAQADSWLRVTAKNELLFEGILPGGGVKEWTGTGPFQFKIGNIRSVSLFWNDQPVDITVGAISNTNKLRIPPQ